MTKTIASKYSIGSRIRELRQERRWTQDQLAKLLGISQNYLSELERGQGSFTAEQLLTILKQFNVPIDYFSTHKAPVENQIQNALARQGATHLLESNNLIPSEQLKQATDAIREALVSAESARQITAIAPILVEHAGNINLAKLRNELADIGLQNRLNWAVENTIEAIRLESNQVLPREWRLKYRRAAVIFDQLFNKLQLEIFDVPKDEPGRPTRYDVLDPDITSAETLKQVKEELSNLSERWKILTRIEVDDFVKALRAARDTD